MQIGQFAIQSQKHIVWILMVVREEAAVVQSMELLRPLQVLQQLQLYVVTQPHVMVKNVVGVIIVVMSIAFHMVFLALIKSINN